MTPLVFPFFPFPEEPLIISYAVHSAPPPYSATWPHSALFDGSTCDMIDGTANYALWTSASNINVIIKVEPTILMKEIVITNPQNTWAKDRNTKGIRVYYSEVIAECKDINLFSEGQKSFK